MPSARVQPGKVRVPPGPPGATKCGAPIKVERSGAGLFVLIPSFRHVRVVISWLELEPPSVPAGTAREVGP